MTMSPTRPFVLLSRAALLLTLAVFVVLPISHAQPASLAFSEAVSILQTTHAGPVSTAYTPPGGVSTLFIAYTLHTRAGDFIDWQHYNGSRFSGSQMGVLSDTYMFLDPALVVLGDHRLACFFAFWGNGTYPNGSLAWSFYLPQGTGRNTWTPAAIATLDPPIACCLSVVAMQDAFPISDAIFLTYADAKGDVYTASGPPDGLKVALLRTRSGQSFNTALQTATVTLQKPSPTVYVVLTSHDTQQATVLYNRAQRPPADEWLQSNLSSHDVDPTSGWRALSYLACNCSCEVLLLSHTARNVSVYDQLVPQQYVWQGDSNVTVGGRSVVAKSLPSPTVWRNAVYLFYLDLHFRVAAVSAPLEAQCAVQRGMVGRWEERGAARE